MAPSSSSQECHICLEELRRDLAAAPCGHVYHHVCILQALQVNSQCPICRRRTGEADVVSLYFDVPGSNDAAASPQKPAQASGDSAELSARVNTLMERIQWQNKHQQQLMDELRRLRSQSEQLLVDKQSQEQRVRSLQAANNELVNKVARYQMELSRQAEAARRSSVNQSIINYLETCDASALEDEIQNPRELIMALKKACKFRHDQYEKVVKEKARLKEMLRNTQPQPTQQPQSAGNARMGKPKSRGATLPMETKRPYPSGSSAMGFGTGIQAPVVENKKRKIDSMASMPYVGQQGSGDAVGFTPRSESAGFRANAYSDVSIRPPPNARSAFGRSNYNPNQYGAFNLTPASQPPVQMTGPQAAVCRRGYDETGKLTNFFLPKEGETRPMPRKKPIPSMQNLLNSQPRTSGQQQRVASNGRQEYALTNWLRNN